MPPLGPRKGFDLVTESSYSVGSGLQGESPGLNPDERIEQNQKRQELLCKLGSNPGWLPTRHPALAYQPETLIMLSNEKGNGLQIRSGTRMVEK
jgi:hypothetical protein